MVEFAVRGELVRTFRASQARRAPVAFWAMSLVQGFVSDSTVECAKSRDIVQYVVWL